MARMTGTHPHPNGTHEAGLGTASLVPRPGPGTSPNGGTGTGTHTENGTVAIGVASVPRPGPATHGTRTRTRRRTLRAGRTKIYVHSNESAGPGRHRDVDSHRPGARHAKKGPEPITRKLAVAINIVIWALSGIATYIAAKGQIKHAEKTGVTDHLKYLFPAALEFTAIGFLLLGYARARQGKNPWPLWAPAIGFGAWAVKLQLDNGGDAGKLFATTTVAALGLWFVKLAGDYRSYLADKDEGGLGWLWITNPRLAFRTTLVKARMRRIRNTSTHIQLAELWIAVYDDSATAQDGKGGTVKVKGRLRRRQAWRVVMVSAGHPIADLPSMASIDRVSVIDRPAPTFVAEPEPPAPATNTRTNKQPPNENASDAAPDARREPKPDPKPEVDDDHDEPDDAPDEPDSSGRPTGRGKADWVPLMLIEGLPAIDPAVVCKCATDESRRCGGTLDKHIERRGRQVRLIIARFPDWPTREGGIRKQDVKDAVGAGSTQQQELMKVFEQLREIAAEQAATAEPAADAGS